VWLYTKSTPAAKPSTGAVVIPATANAAAGAGVFADAGCGDCHTFKAASSTGQAGPNLDTLAPGYEQVRDQVENGGGGMPSFGGRLSDQQISDVAAFVASRASP